VTGKTQASVQLTNAASGRQWKQVRSAMKERRPRNEKEVYSDVERQWRAAAGSKPRTSSATSALILVVVFVVLCVAAYLNRARIGALWQQVTGKAPPLWIMPEKPQREGPEIEGRDF